MPISKVKTIFSKLKVEQVKQLIDIDVFIKSICAATLMFYPSYLLGICSVLIVWQHSCINTSRMQLRHSF
jgi:hypothetical protein